MTTTPEAEGIEGKKQKLISTACCRACYRQRKQLVEEIIAELESTLHHQLQKAREEERERISLLVDSLSISIGAPERAMDYKAAWQFGNDVLENVKRKLLKAINK